MCFVLHSLPAGFLVRSIAGLLSSYSMTGLVGSPTLSSSRSPTTAAVPLVERVNVHYSDSVEDKVTNGKQMVFGWVVRTVTT